VYFGLFFIAIALLIGSLSVWRNGWMTEGENYPNFSVMAMACVVLSQLILIIGEEFKVKNSKNIKRSASADYSIIVFLLRWLCLLGVCLFGILVRSLKIKIILISQL